MKRSFTILTAALALLACLAIPVVMWADEAQYVFNTDAGIAALGISKPSSGAGTSLSTTTPYTVGQISMSVTHGSTDTRVWNSSGTLDLRIYKSGGTLTFAAVSGYNITGITIAGSAVGNFTVNSGTYSSGSWSNGTTGASSVTFTATNTGKINTITVIYSASGSSLQESNLTLVDAPVELEFDLYDNANAQTISYTTSSTGAVTVSQSNYITTTVNANNTITVIPVAVTNGPQTITVNQAADNTYAAGSVTFTVDIDDSTPTTGLDVTFDATQDLGNITAGEGTIEKSGVTFTCSNGILGNGSEYRLYKNSATTFSVASGTITKIVFTCPSGNPASGFASQTGWTTSGTNGIWTGNATSVSFSASGAQVRATTIVVTIETSGTPDPAISAGNVDIAYSATSGSIAYTINNEPSPAGTLTAAVTNGNWLTLGQGTTSPIAFTCTANENTTARTATVTLTYNYGTNQTVTANVTVTQAAAPVSYATIPALFAAATTTETSVLVTFNNWVVSGVSTNGKNVYVTDNNGNGFVIYFTSDMSSTFEAGNILSGTAVSCKLKLYNGAAELVDLDASDLTITTGGTVSTSNIALADLAGVNTGALVHYDNLTCSVDDSDNITKYYLSDGTTTLQVYNALYAFDALENGKSYNITGIYQQYNSTKEILPRSAADIVENTTCYTVTLCDDQSELTEQSHGAGVTLPSRSASGAYTFAGWSTINVATETTTAPATIYSAGVYHPTMDIVLYPVYTKTEGSGSTTTEWHLLSDLSEADAGVYALLTEHYYAFNGSINASTVGDGGVTSGYFTFDANNIATSAPDGTLEITFVPVEEGRTVVGFKLLDPTTNKYLYASKNASGNLGWHVLENSYWSVHSNGNWYYPTSNGDAYLRSYSDLWFRTYGQNHGSLLKLAKKVEVTTGTTYYTSLLSSYVLSGITGYGINYNPETDANEHWYLIASPLAGNTNPMSVDHLLNTAGYDLYRFDQKEELEWRNYKTNSFNLEAGKGYLYANSESGDITFYGTANDPSQEFSVTLEKGGNNDSHMNGWNLVGNPFTVDAYITKPFYKMNPEGNAILSNSSTGAIATMEGVFVMASTNEEELTFTTEEPAKNASLSLNITKGRSVIDRAIVSFGESELLPKFQFRDGSTKVYIPMDGKDYAVVNAEGEGEKPVNFKAEENGHYTITVNPEEVEFNYLHLIDNMTGANIDLLVTPSYSFEARTTDYASRFRLVFSATGIEENNVNEAFAYFNGTEWMVNNEGEASLEVIDLTGRILSSETINGNVAKAITAAPGIYMLRLVNDNEVKTQKILVK